MFEAFSDYLAGLHCLSDLLCKRAATTQPTSNTTVRDDEVVDDIRQGTASSSHQQLPRVELVSLLTEVSGLVRERSQFTQYMNYHYKLSKECKPVVLELLPTDQSEAAGNN